MDFDPYFLNESSDSEDSPELETTESIFEIIPSDKTIYETCSSKSWWVFSFSRNAKYHFSAFFKKSLSNFYFMSDSSIFLLGSEYPAHLEKKRVEKPLRADLKAIIWMSYRSYMLPVVGENKVFTSDSGWGCTIRVGQMLLLNTLKKHFELKPQQCLEIIKTVEDNLIYAPYSLRAIVTKANCGIAPGKWYSPSHICHSLAEITSQSPINGFKCVVFMDSLIFKDKVYSIACDTPFEKINENRLLDSEYKRYKGIGKWKNGILILIPLMLGVKKIDESYYETFKVLLKSPNSVGVIGGKPRSALYIVGFKDSEVIYLDPHFVQKASSSLEDLKKRYYMYFNRKFLTAEFSELESSMSVGYYFRNEYEFRNFQSFLEKNEDSIKGVIAIKDYTPQYMLSDQINLKENEDGFIMIS